MAYAMSPNPNCFDPFPAGKPHILAPLPNIKFKPIIRNDAIVKLYRLYSIVLYVSFLLSIGRFCSYGLSFRYVIAVRVDIRAVFEDPHPPLLLYYDDY